ncbi:hypothetical protein D9599_25890 [Roseomonas sp. KE2513]|nr:hypothetical protein [Roseomonas sp. KE2513]
MLPLHAANGATVTLLRDATEAQCMAMARDTTQRGTGAVGYCAKQGDIPSDQRGRVEAYQ